MHEGRWIRAGAAPEKRLGDGARALRVVLLDERRERDARVRGAVFRVRPYRVEDVELPRYAAVDHLVVREDVVLREARLVVHCLRELRIAARPRLGAVAEILGLLDEVPARIVRIVPVVRPGHAAVVEMDRDVAVRDSVPHDGVLASAADHHRAARALEDVGDYRIAAVAVVEVHAHREDVVAASVRHRLPEVVDVVSRDDVAAARPVASGVERSRVPRLLHDVEHVVVRDEVLVAAVDDRGMRGVVDAAADDLVAASAERDARRVDALHEREAMDVAPDHSVAALREALPVASVEDDSASADVAHHAVRDDDSCAVRADLDAGPRDALDGAVRDQHVVAVAENEPRAASERDGASAQRLAAAVLEQQHGVVAPRERHGPCGDVSAGRDEEEGPAVEYPLARGVEEAAVVDGVEAALLLPPARLADSELVAVCEADASVLHGRDAQHLEGPVVRPVSGERIAVRRKVLHDDVVLPLECEPAAVGFASERLRLAAEVERGVAWGAGPSAAP